jgi:hypothetical protein
MSGFRPGDVVVCVDDMGCPTLGTRCPYAKNGIYRVTEVKSGVNLAGEPATGLKTTHYALSYWNVTQFRHLPKADEQFTADMRACKPARVGEPA